MAKIETIKQEVTFKLELSEKELSTLVGSLGNPHSNNSRNARNEGLMNHLGASDEMRLYNQLLTAVKGGRN